MGQPVVVAGSWGLGANPEPTARLREGGFVGRALSLRRAAFEPLSPPLSLDPVGERPALRHALAAPVSDHNDINAVLVAGFAEEPQDPDWTLWAAESHAALIALYLDAPSALDGLLTAARTDSLTGCLTYENLRHELTREINRSTRTGLGLACCFIDLDGFKRINDDHGHLQGNHVLANVAQILREGVRSCDTVGRYGGDEFVAILPQTAEPDAQHLAGRLRTMIAEARFPPLDAALTASVGVEVWKPGVSADELLAGADEALLSAKARRQ